VSPNPTNGLPLSASGARRSAQAQLNAMVLTTSVTGIHTNHHIAAREYRDNTTPR
jgi:hypothetical protein